MRKQLGFSIASALLMFSALAVGQSLPVQVNRSGYQVDVLIAGKPFTTYYFDPAMAKPYLQPLRSAQGTIVTRGFPNGNTVPPAHAHDPNLEPHQRPLAFAHGNTDGLDFWEEQTFEKDFYDQPSRQAYGKLVFERLVEASGGPNSGTIQSEFNMVGPGDWILGEETQRFTFSGDENTRVVDCEFILHASHGPLVMGDTKEGSFGIRVAPELNSPPGTMVNSLGGVGEKAIWGKRADWVDYDGVVAGEPVGIAVLDHPESFRHPTWWHARHYGLLAANPFGLREFTGDPNQDGSWTISDGGSLALRYRVLVHHGDYQQAKVAEAYRQYAATK
jgi:hypothetical protein